MKPLCVLHVTVGFEMGGTEKFLAHFLPLLDRNLFSPMLCVFKSKGMFAPVLERSGIPVFALNGRGKWDVRVVWRLFKILRSHKVDIVHSHLFLANFLCAVLSAFVRVPVCITSQRAMDLWKKRHHHFMDRITLFFCHTMVVCSNAVRKEIISHHSSYARKIVVIYNGLSLSEFDMPIPPVTMSFPPQRPIIGTVGRLDEHVKGHSYLVEAVAILKERGIKASLVIVGDGQSREYLNLLVRRLKLDESVLFVGTKDDVRPFLASMDIFVMPSLEEGFGFALAEAMALGRVVVASRIGGIPEIVEDGVSGVLVSPRDSQALSNALQHLIMNPEFAQKLAVKGREEVRRRFSLEKNLTCTQNLYKKFFVEKTF